MTKVKLKYVGHAPILTLLKPIGTTNPKRAREKMDLYPGVEFELEKDDAEKLLAMDKAKETAFEKKVVIERIHNEKNAYREVIRDVAVTKETNKQVNFELVEEVFEVKEVEEDDSDAPKRGRPKGK
ncbi:MAG: hypothetical protein KDD13_00280 [Mangrovimonas sp.]|nr:hypothetical protein [Mangrovimonas sp.]